MRLGWLAVVLAFSLAAGVAYAQTDPQAGTASPQSAEQVAPPDTASNTESSGVPAEEAGQVICRTVQRTESRLRSSRERVCGTRDQWEHMQEEAARQTQSTDRGNAPAAPQ